MRDERRGGGGHVTTSGMETTKGNEAQAGPAFRRLDVGPVEFAYREQGAGEPVVLLHGVTCCSNVFGWVMEGLAGRHRVCALDLVGYGDSSLDGSLTREGYLAALDAFLEGWSPSEPVSLLGHSMGSMMAIAYASRCPSRVRRLVLSSPVIPARLLLLLGRTKVGSSFVAAINDWFVPAELAVMRRRLRRIVLNVDELSDEAVANLCDGAQKSRGNALAGRVASGVPGGLWAALGRVKCPVVVVVGDRDRMVPWRRLPRLEKKGSLRVETIHGAKHMPMLEKPEEYLAAVLRALEI